MSYICSPRKLTKIDTDFAVKPRLKRVETMQVCACQNNGCERHTMNPSRVNIKLITILGIM